MLNTRGTGVWNLLDKDLKHSLHKKKEYWNKNRIYHCVQDNYSAGCLDGTTAYGAKELSELTKYRVSFRNHSFIAKCAKCTLHRYPRFPLNRRTQHEYPPTTFHKLLYSSFVPNVFVFLSSPMFPEEVARYTEITCTQMVDRLHRLRSKWTKPRV